MCAVEDMVIRTLVRTCGYQRGMYKGNIPEYAETWKEVANSKPDTIVVHPELPFCQFSFELRGKHHVIGINDVTGQSLRLNNFIQSPVPVLYVSTKYYPLLINIMQGTMDDGPCVNIQWVDLIHDKVLATGIVDSMGRQGEYCGQYEGDIIEDRKPIVERWGCTDPNALNYDSNANCDNGSCRYRKKKPNRDIKK
ncbi:MAG TPA: hypothetical protein VKH37_09765 [Ferruginibacter sp.]|nr:hypothetical protein [Ferruginibacter sp.]